MGSLTADEKKQVNYNDVAKLNKLKKKVAEEYIDYANLFVKEYLTTDKTVYKPGTDGTSISISNGYTENEFKKNPTSTKEALVKAKSEFGKLSDAAKEAIGDSRKPDANGVFYAPKLDELFNKVVDSISASKVFEDLINEEFNKLCPTTKTPDEQIALEDIRDKAIDEIKNGITVTVSVSYQESGVTTDVDLTIVFNKDGTVKEVVKKVNNVETAVILTRDQLRGIENILVNSDTKGSLSIQGDVLESIIQIPTNATDKVITKVDISLVPLTAEQLERVFKEIISELGRANGKDRVIQVLDFLEKSKDEMEDIKTNYPKRFRNGKESNYGYSNNTVYFTLLD